MISGHHQLTLVIQKVQQVKTSNNLKGKTADLAGVFLGFILTSVLSSFFDLGNVTLLLIFCATLWNTTMVTFKKHFANWHLQQNLSI